MLYLFFFIQLLLLPHNLFPCPFVIMILLCHHYLLKEPLSFLSRSLKKMQDKLTQIFIYITPLFISYTLIKHVSLLLSLSIISKDVFKFFRTILTHTHEISFVPQNTYPRSYPSPLKVLTSHTFLKLSIIDALTTF